MDPRCSVSACDDCPIRLACRCFQVTEEAVVQALTMYNLRTVKDIRRHTGAGDGCTCCHKRLEQLLERLVGVREAVA